MNGWERVAALALFLDGCYFVLSSLFPWSIYNPFVIPAFVILAHVRIAQPLFVFAILLPGAFQIAFGGYWAVKKDEWLLRWYWLVSIAIVLAGALWVVVAATHRFFGLIR